jgi:hypothetical protein
MQYTLPRITRTEKTNFAHCGSLSKAFEINSMIAIVSENKQQRYFLLALT